MRSGAKRGKASVNNALLGAHASNLFTDVETNASISRRLAVLIAVVANVTRFVVAGLSELFHVSR